MLDATVSQYNAAVDAGQGATLDPVRTTSAYKAHAIRKPPYYAVQLCAGITFTMGGLAIDGAARVLDRNNEPIRGVYAAGCAAGGLEGGGHAGYVGGLAKSSVTALLAANHIAANRA
jgi:fumarate reductase flavoprotein subunit